MRIWNIFALFVIGIPMSFSQGHLPVGPGAVRVFFDGKEQLRKLSDWKDVWAIDSRDGFAIVPATEAERDILEDMGFRTELDLELTRLLYQPAIPEGDSGIPGFSCYQTVEETYTRAAELAATYPNLAEWVDYGDSWEKTQNPDEGYDLMVLQLTNPASPFIKSELMVVSGLHAREYAPVGINMAFAEWLLAGYNVDANAMWILDTREIHLIFHANPDGRKQAETGILWRKNANNLFCSDTNDRGVDLNRNFPFQWGCCGGASGLECHPTYRGPFPISEPETDAIIDHARGFLLDQKPDDPLAPAPDIARGVFIDIHSFGQWVLWPYGYDHAVQTPNGTALQTLGRKFAWFNNYWPERASVSFDTDGTTDDYAYGEFGVAAYTFEVGTWFFEDCDNFENTILPSNLEALIYAAKVADFPYQRPSGPDAVDLTLNCEHPFQGDVLDLTVTLDDTRTNGANGQEPVQNIAWAAFYIDTPPWDINAVPVFLAPIDGVLDSPTEEMGWPVSTGHLATGRHTLYVWGEDENGRIGVADAIYFTVREAYFYTDWPATASVLDLLPMCAPPP